MHQPCACLRTRCWRGSKHAWVLYSGRRNGADITARSFVLSGWTMPCCKNRLLQNRKRPPRSVHATKKLVLICEIAPGVISDHQRSRTSLTPVHGQRCSRRPFWRRPERVPFDVNCGLVCRQAPHTHSPNKHTGANAWTHISMKLLTLFAGRHQAFHTIRESTCNLELQSSAAETTRPISIDKE